MINMENREEILKNKAYLSLIKEEQKLVIIYDDVINSMQEYSDQQNKQLLEEIDLLNTINVKLNDNNIKLLDEIEMLKFQLKAADSVNEGLSNLIKDVYDKTDNVKIFLLIEERLESNDLMNIILPNHPK